MLPGADCPKPEAAASAVANIAITELRQYFCTLNIAESSSKPASKCVTLKASIVKLR
jgi:hypothetical protein